MKYIDAEKLIAEIERQKHELKLSIQSQGDYGQSCHIVAYENIISLIDSLQQEKGLAEKIYEATLVAKRLADRNSFYNSLPESIRYKYTDKEWDVILETLCSLQQEQPEVDLEKEMDRFFEGMPIQEHENIFEDTYQMIARHFYELGLNARKEDSR